MPGGTAARGPERAAQYGGGGGLGEDGTVDRDAWALGNGDCCLLAVNKGGNGKEQRRLLVTVGAAMPHAVDAGREECVRCLRPRDLRYTPGLQHTGPLCD